MTTYAERTLYLASQSPRRRSMMRWLGIPCALLAVDIDETPLPGEKPVDLATRLARAKAAAAGAQVGSNWVLAADTVVDFDGESLGKPADADEAWQMLRALRGREHHVHTAVALSVPGNADLARKVTARRVTTRVWMRTYSDQEIAEYVTTGDPMDKAGAYAIQHTGFRPVREIDRCYANVMGLPLGAVVRLLCDAGWSVDVDVPAVCEQHLDYPCENPDEGEPV